MGDRISNPRSVYGADFIFGFDGVSLEEAEPCLSCPKI